MKLYTEITKSKTQISWNAPIRYWEQKNRIWFINYSLFFLLLMMIGAVLGQYLFILLVLTFGGMWFLQAVIEPSRHTITINDKGIKALDTFFTWKKIKYFWVSQKDGIYYIHLDLGSVRFENINQSQVFFIIPEQIYNDAVAFLIKKVEYGLRSEVQYTILSRFLYGKYISLNTIIEQKPDDQS